MGRRQEKLVQERLQQPPLEYFLLPNYVIGGIILQAQMY